MKVTLWSEVLPLKAQERSQAMSLSVSSVPSGSSLWVGDSAVGPAPAGWAAAAASSSVCLRRKRRHMNGDRLGASSVGRDAISGAPRSAPYCRFPCTWQRLWRGQFGVAARGVDAADLDEAGHEHNEGDAHQQHRPPVSLKDTEALQHVFMVADPPGLQPGQVLHFLSRNTHHDPLGNIFVEFCVEDGFLESCQWPISVHQSAPHEHVAVALEVVAGRAGLQRYDRPVEELGPFVRARAAAGAGVH